MYSLIRPCPLLGGSQETFTVPSSLFRQDSCRFVGGSGTTSSTAGGGGTIQIKDNMKPLMFAFGGCRSVHNSGTHIPLGSGCWSCRWSCTAYWGTEWALSLGRWCLVVKRSACSWSCCCGCSWCSTAAYRWVWTQEHPSCYKHGWQEDGGSRHVCGDQAHL